MKKRRKNDAQSRSDADSLFLLLAFAAGVLTAHFRPETAELLPKGRDAAAAALLIPALLAGAPAGVWLIPAAALLLGCSAAQSAAAVTALLRESGVGAIDALLPLAVLLPAFFLLAASAMRLSGEAWSALSRLGRFGRGELLMRHALLWCAGLGAVLLRLLA